VPFKIVKKTESVAIATPSGILVSSYLGMRKTVVTPAIIITVIRMVLRVRTLPRIFGIWASSLDISLTAIVNKPMSAAIEKNARNSYISAYSPYPSTER